MMIADNQTTFLYLADTLEKNYPGFFARFVKTLAELKIPFDILPGTKDVWVVDYMPIQIEKDKLVQFVYNPDYLRDSIIWLKTISDVDGICAAKGFQPRKSPIVLDGGNVTRTADKVIMCDKIFTENPEYPEKDLIKELKELFEVDHLFFIPTHPIDFTGHADGMVRFYDKDTVLINDYSKEKPEFQRRFRLALHNAGLKCVEIPYNPYGNKTNMHANGEYINFLQMKQGIVLPVFGMAEDDKVFRQFEQLYPGVSITTVDSNEPAYDGGILNCITWNILK